ncbi:cell division protein FtsQ/DivIB [Paucibacter sp. R3-3]|uniref:Cell division protein FtsQ n=1 Tax=Roseateles agri TaxID=3098619 RepID=A0ABU5DA26_9BURK|nr:cell division protein FtsQ/DivIB [Paucibacter sp. R3-3]MDY0743083.1 cell division protein FtsQ/DivIB [Paucibacter sp. R3-3]
MPTLRPPASLPPDIRLMNAVSALLVLALVLIGLGFGLRWVAALPVFSIRQIQIEGDVQRNNVATLRANALPHLAGTFLSMNLQAGRQVFEAVPWVRHAMVQRVWPSELRVKLEEHQPAAYWETKVDGADADSEASADRQLVNSFGEVFQANLGDVEDEDLPTLAGPEGSSAQMLRMWQLLGSRVKPLDDGIDRLDLSGRGSWRMTLEKGAVIELGRGSEAEVLARFEQFVRTITQVTGRYQAPLLSADLRHTDGYAVRLAGVSTTPNPDKKSGSKRN